MALSFRTRLTLSYSLVLAALLGTAAAVLIVTLQRIAERKLDATLWVLGATEAEGTVADMRDRNLRIPDDRTVHDVDYRQLPGYQQFPVQKYVTVVDAGHIVRDFSANLPGGPLPVSDRLLTDALANEISYDTQNVEGVGRLRLIYIPVIGQQTDPFVVIVGVPTAFVGAELGTLFRRVAVIIMAVLVLAALSGLLLARRALRPVSQTADAVKLISDRNLHDRLPEPGTKDEIDHLIKVFNELLARLDRAFDLQRRFTSDASHEIGTPLTVLKGNTEVALLGRHSPQEYEAVLRSNLEEIERLSKLISNLLLLARTDAGEPQITKDIISLNDQVSAVYARVAALAEERGVKLETGVSAPAFIEGDPVALQQILLNLVTNALRYTAAGGRVSINVAQAHDSMAKVEVSDTGVGISRAELPRIFDRFYRGKNVRTHAPVGSGLGLAICQTLAEAHGGRIEVESELGEGSRFILILPAIEFSDARATD
jgi:two-component system, OmpR family, sensor kinase